MSYLLLTGATGLLGSYLLRDLLLAGRRVAVVVRASRTESARQRVESLLSAWERDLGRTLPRPPVLEGDICRPAMGFDADTLRWVAANCHAVLHNAASLSFSAEEKTGEPYRSNVEGTKNTLELCRQTGIRRFHHVSTAYVCGLRTGVVREDELDVGQQPGNDYETSKIAAEKLVRSAEWIDQFTVYRPAIIIGDANTGYTTTFHGFYTPLKIAQGLADRGLITEVNGAPMLLALNLAGHERKNFVPVDWVAQVITYLSGRPELHGKTYHLTPEQAVPVSLVVEAVEAFLHAYLSEHRPAQLMQVGFEEIATKFIEQMETYRAYWRDDPDFDKRNTRAAAPHLPCPTIDAPMLIRTAMYAMQVNFGWPKPRPIKPDFDVLEHLTRKVPVDFGSGTDRTDCELVGMQVNGPGGGQWTLVVDGDRLVAARCGLAEPQTALAYLNSRTFERCVRGELTFDEAHRRGQLAADGLERDQLMRVLQTVVGA